MSARLAYVSLVLLLTLTAPSLKAQVLPGGGGGTSPTFPVTTCFNAVGVGITAQGVLTCTPVTPDMTTGLAVSGGDVSVSGEVTQTHLAVPLPLTQGGLGLTSGTSGGILYFASPTTLASSPQLPLNTPLFGGGPGAAPLSGLRSGTTLEVATVLGPHTIGKQLAFDANGNVIASAFDVGGGGGGGAVTSVFGRQGAVVAQPGDYSADQVSNAANLLQANTFGHPSGQTMPQLNLMGSFSGTLSLKAPPFAGTSVITFPLGSLDMTTTGGVGQVLKQLTAAGPLSVGTLAFSDISGTATAGQVPSLPNLSGVLPVGKGGLGWTDTTVSGTTHMLATVAGPLSVGTCVTLDAQLNLTSSGGPCGNVAGIATPVDNQIAVWTSATQIEGTSALTYSAGALGVGAVGTLGKVTLAGNTSGVITMQPQASFTSYNWNYPTSAGTSGQVLTSGGGTTAPMTWTTLAASATTDTTNAGNITSGTLAIARGGTGTGTTLVGLVRGSASAMTAAELSGDVTTSGSNVTTIASGAVSYTKIQNVTATRLLGRGDSGIGSPQEIQIGSGLSLTGTTLSAIASGTVSASGTPVDNQLAIWTSASQIEGTPSLTYTGGTLSLGTTGTLGRMTLAGNTSGLITLQPQAVAGTYNWNYPITAGTLGQVLTSAAGGVAPMTWTTLAASATTDTTDATNITSGTLACARLPALTGSDVTSSAGSCVTTIAAGAVTYAKMQDVSAASRLLGRGDSGAGDPQELTLGSGLAITGTVLSVTAGGGNVSNVGTPLDNQIAVWTSASQIEGTPSFTFNAGTLGVGAVGTLGRLTLAGSTSGVITLQPQATAGTFNWNYPTTAGTLGQVLTSASGGASPMTWTTLAASATIDTTNAGNITSGTLAIARGGTGTGTTLVGLVRGSPSAMTAAELSGDVTTSGSNVTTIAAGAVTYAKMQDITASRLLGRGSSGTGDPEEIQIGSGLSLTGTTLSTIASGNVSSVGTPVDNQIAVWTSASQIEGTSALTYSAGTLGIGAVGTLGKVTLAGSTSGVITVQPQAVAGTYNWNYPITAGTLGQVLTSGGGTTVAMTWTTLAASATTDTTDATNITSGTLACTRLPALTGGDVTSSAGSCATTIATNAVTYAKMQDISGASRLLGRGDSSPGDPQEIQIGAGLSITGTTLSASGTALVSGTPVDNQIAVWTSASQIEGTSALTYSAGTLALGTTGTLGRVNLAGSTSGVITLQPQAVAGTYNWNYPTTAGTTGQVLTSAAGGATPMTWTTLATSATIDTTNATNITSGTLACPRLPALTGGDVTSSAGSCATTIAPNTVSYAKMQDVSAASRLVGRGDSGPGDPQEITLGSGLAIAGTVLSVTAGGGNVSSVATPLDNQIAVWTSASQIEGTPSFTFNAGTLAIGAVGTLGKVTLAGNTSGVITLQPQAVAGTFNWNYPTTAGTSGQVLTSGGGTTAPMTWTTLATSATTDTTNAGNITSGTLACAQHPALTGGDVTSSAGSCIATIAAGAVTYAKMQDISAASRLLGRGDSGAGDPQELTLGSGLAITGTVLSVTAGGGNVSNVGTPLDNQIAVWTSASQIEGTPALTYNAGTLALGTTGTLGRMTLAGNTSGTITLQPQAAAGTYNWNYPITAGTTGQVLTSGGGTTVAMTWTTLAASATTDTTNAGNITSGTLAIARGGTGTGTTLVGVVRGSASAMTAAELSGDVTTSGSNVTTIPANTVTYAKMQDVTASRLLGRGSSGTGDPEEIQIGSGLSLAGTTLSSTSNVSSVATPVDNQIAVWTSATQIEGTPALTYSAGTLALGAVGTLGQMTLAGSTSGVITLQPQAVAGTYNWNYPTTAGTIGQVLTSAAGGAAPMTWTTLATSATIDTTNAGNITSGTLAIARGGTGTGTTLVGLVRGSASAMTAAELSGDVTTSGSNVTTIGAGAVSYAKIQNVTATRLLGRGDSGTGSPQEIQIGAGLSLTGTTLSATGSGTVSASGTPVDNQIAVWTSASQIEGTSAFTFNAGTLGIGAVGALGRLTLAGSTSGTITLQPQAVAGTYNWNYPATAGTLGQVLTSAAGGASPMTWTTLAASATIDTTNAGNITSGTLACAQHPALTGGDVTSSAGSCVATIATNAVTYAKMQDISGPSRLLGRGDSSGGDPQELTLGSGLTITGTVLSVSAGGGNVSSVATPVDNQIAVWTSASQIEGTPSFTFNAGTLGIGAVGTLGKVTLAGNTSGVITLQPQAAAGTYNWNFPTTAGTTGQVLTSAGGTTIAMTWTTLAASATIDTTNATNITSGTLACAQHPALTGGDVTSSAGSCVTTIAPNTVTYAKMQDVTASRLLGRGDSGIGDPQEIQIGAGLSLTGTTLSAIASGTVSASGTPIDNQIAVWTSATQIEGTPALTYSGGALSVGTTGTLGRLTLAGNTSGVITLQPQAAAGTFNWNYPTTAGTTGQVLTSAAGGAAPMTWTTLAASATTDTTTAANITSGTLVCARLPALTGGDVTSSAGSCVTTIPANTVTYAKMQDVTASRLLGRGDSGIGDPEEIQIGFGLSITGTTLSASGNVASVATPVDNQIAVWTSATQIEGTSALTYSTGTLGVGAVGTLGRLTLAGNTSGVITLQPQAAAGTFNWNYPTSAGTAGQVLTSGGGATAPMTWTTLATSATTDTTNAGNITSGTLAIARGGTGTGTTLVGVVRGSASAMTAAELSGDVTTSGSNVTTIPANTVTYAKMQDVTASRLLGRGDSAAGDPQEIQIGSGLSLTGTTLSATGGGTISASGTPVDNQIAVWTSASQIEGTPALTYNAGTLALGTTGTLGRLTLAGNTSGAITLQPQAVAGTFNWNYPTSAGTTGQVLTSAAGGVAPMTWTTLATSATTDTTNAANITSGTLTIARGGTGTGTTLVGLVRGSASAMTAAELSGDVTTSGSNVTTIASGAVSYTKIQNVTATARLLGRTTAGAGPMEELTAATAKTLLGYTFTDVSGSASMAQLPAAARAAIAITFAHLGGS